MAAFGWGCSKIDVDEKGSLEKGTVYSGLEEAGEGNYDTVRPTSLPSPLFFEEQC